MISEKLQKKIDERKVNDALRELGTPNNLIDFSSNDYLGFSKNETIFKSAHKYLIDNNLKQNGATSSRLLSGNHSLYETVEVQLCKFYNSESALVFNSGYDANLGFFSCVPQRDDIIYYDEFIHASIRDGITMSNAKAYKFKHNDLKDLKQKCLNERSRNANEREIYIITESVFSMDGDTPNLNLLSQLCDNNNYNLIVDEAHAIGIFGEKGAGLAQTINTFARIVTFGKALGCHGAAILGSDKLKQYLVNFSRPFIYTTGLSPHSLSTIQSAHEELQKTSEIKKLYKNISFFKSEIKRLQLENKFIKSDSAIHCFLIPGNEKVKQIAVQLQKNNYNVKPILSPTVRKGEERLRFCIHSYNTQSQITEVLQLLANLVIK